MSEETRERRDYLRTVLGIVAGLAVGGFSTWLAKPKEVERVVETITEREKIIIQPPTTTIPVPGATITERVEVPGPTVTVTKTITAPITPTPTPENFELKVTVPSYISLSTPDNKKPARLNVYLRTAEALSGLFSVYVEFGIKIRLPVVKLCAFVDIDLTILGKTEFDRFRFEYPISGVPTEVMSLESGEVGVYALAVPVEAAEVELESLTVGEWYHVGSYDLYVVEEQKLVALGIPAENVTIGEVEKI